MSKDQDLFNCSQKHEENYVVSLYAKDDRPAIRTFLQEKCEDGTISNSTHAEVYALIEEELGFTRE